MTVKREALAHREIKMWNLRTKSASGEEVFNPLTKKNLTNQARHMTVSLKAKEKEKIKNGKTSRGRFTS